MVLRRVRALIHLIQQSAMFSIGNSAHMLRESGGGRAGGGPEAEADRTCHVQESDLAGLCDTCSRIPWAKFTNPKQQIFELLEIQQSFEELKDSTCRVCRFYGECMALYTKRGTRGYTKSPPPYMLTLDTPTPGWEINTTGQTYGLLNLTKKRERYQPNAPIMNGRILVLNQPAEMHTPAEYLFPTGMPLELFQEALRICKLYHGANCRPQSTDTIRNLKIYDIERREIICAPVGCQYVA
jgi:hypothetical protein